MNEYFEAYSSVSDEDFLCLESFRTRKDCTRKYSFAIPDEDALKLIAKYSPILEMGAGSGYWAYLLQKEGVDVIAYDNSSWEWETKWTSIRHGDPTTLKDMHEDRTLMLCWPNYAEPFAYDCLKNYKGRYFIYIGEGPGGCTGDDDFHEYLENNFSEVDFYKIPQWFGIHDFLWVYERKK
jgi:hypothetical protein